MMIKNNKGFGKFEVLTMIVLLVCLLAYLMYAILQGSTSQKYGTMIDNAISLTKAVSSNRDSFINTDYVYLDEVISGGYLSKIRSPFSSNYCDASQSKVVYSNGVPHVTLKCDNYLIEDEKIVDKDSVTIYELGDLTTEKTNDDDEELTLYNCIDEGKEIYSDYYEDKYFIYKLNLDYETSYYSISDTINICEKTSKTFYRTKTVVER